jgi:hypothetical protein
VKRSAPIKRRRTTKRRTTTPRCSVRSCNTRAEIRGWCIKHAEAVADRLFSKWVRARDGGCTAAGVLEGECKGILQCAHVNGRGKKSVRFDPRNSHTLCAAHHYTVDQHGREAEKRLWASSVLGATSYDLLMDDALELGNRRQATEEALSWLASPGGTKE